MHLHTESNPPLAAAKRVRFDAERNIIFRKLHTSA